MKSPLYYNPGTPSSGSADPLRHAMQMRSVLRTGWGPRGDSGATRRVVCELPNPLVSFSASLRITDQRVWKEGLHLGPPFLLHPSVSALHSRPAACRDISISRSRMNGLRIVALVQSEGFARQVRAIANTAARIMVFQLAILALNQMSVLVAQAAEPALPKLKTETQGAFERYLRLVEARYGPAVGRWALRGATRGRLRCAETRRSKDAEAGNPRQREAHRVPRRDDPSLDRRGVHSRRETRGRAGRA